MADSTAAPVATTTDAPVAQAAAPANATGTAAQAAAPATQAAPAEEPTDWKAEARKWESRAKENKTAADKLAEIEEASKTETQKAIERAEKAEKALAKRENDDALTAARAEVSKATGVPAAALRGTTKEELEAHAAELAPLIAPPEKKGALGPYVPAEGSATSGTPGTNDWLRDAFVAGR